MPKRVQLKRTKGWHMPENTVKVDRTTRWGNPFAQGKVSSAKKLGNATPAELRGVKVRDREHAVELFRQWIFSGSETAAEWRENVSELRGRNLACWCPLDGHCHADTLLELANGKGAPKKADGVHAHST